MVLCTVKTLNIHFPERFGRPLIYTFPIYSHHFNRIFGATEAQVSQSYYFGMRCHLLYIYIYIYTVYIIHSFSILSDDRSKASSKTMPPYSAIQSLLLQMRISSPVLKVIQQLLTSSSWSSCHFHLPLYLSFDNLF